MCIRYSYKEAEIELKKAEKFLSENNYEFSVTGSMRRKKSTIGDIDIIIKADKKEFDFIINNYKEIEEIEDREKFVVKLKSGIPMQFIFVEENYLFHRWSSTGSKKHVKNIKEIYEKNRIELIENITSENEIYKRCGMSYLPPEKREEI